jgi:hypothetical protein
MASGSERSLAQTDRRALEAPPKESGGKGSERRDAGQGEGKQSQPGKRHSISKKENEPEEKRPRSLVDPASPLKENSRLEDSSANLVKKEAVAAAPMEVEVAEKEKKKRGQVEKFGWIQNGSGVHPAQFFLDLWRHKSDGRIRGEFELRCVENGSSKVIIGTYEIEKEDSDRCLMVKQREAGMCARFLSYFDKLSARAFLLTPAERGTDHDYEREVVPEMVHALIGQVGGQRRIGVVAFSLVLEFAPL